MKTTLYVTTVLLFLFTATKGFAQTLHFDIFIAGKKSGTLVSQYTGSAAHQFSIRSEAKFTAAFTDIYSLLEVTYQKEQLQQASVLQKINGKVREHTNITRKEAKYHIQKKDEAATTLNKEVTYSVATLYHIEPTGKKIVFSERFGSFCTLRALAPHIYELELPDGKKATYIYENGVCTQVKSRQMMMDIRFELLDKKSTIAK